MAQGLPAVLPLLPGLVLPRRRPSWQQAPPVVVRAEGVRLDPSHLERFLGVVGGIDPPAVALTFPYVVAAPLHVAVVSHPDFPLPPLGLVHVRERIRRWRTLAVGTRVDLEARTEAFREVPSGVAFDLVTTMTQDGQRVWDSRTQALWRTGGTGRGGQAGVPAVATGAVLPLPVPRGAGRSYGLVAGNLDPIHVSRWTAMPFGFSRAVVHGMWTVGRCVAELGDPLGPASVLVRFRTPLPAPSQARLVARPGPPHDGGGLELAVWGAGHRRPVLEGRLVPAVVGDDDLRHAVAVEEA
ncbi:MAG: acyl dehydratase [Alphaproteobacteria bacterium]|nr:acyl dehydratase [Alphaproteobacteria bacterium]